MHVFYILFFDIKRPLNEGVDISCLTFSLFPGANISKINFAKLFLQPTWCYSKYIEALEQERILLKIQEELERKLFAGKFCSLFSGLLCCLESQVNSRGFC